MAAPPPVAARATSPGGTPTAAAHTAGATADSALSGEVSTPTPASKDTAQTAYDPPSSPPPAFTTHYIATPTPTSTLAQPQAQAHAQSQAPPEANTGTGVAAPRQTHANPKVEELHQMFPTVEIGVIELVLETTGGSTDRSIEQLLAMTDPNFKPDELEGTREDAQVDLDAEFARSLQLADEEDYRRESNTHHRHQQGSGFEGQGQEGQLPYQPRVRRARAPGSAPQGAVREDAFFDPADQERRYAPWNSGQGQGQDQGHGQGANPPGMLAFEEKVEKYAEVGKQTFNSLLSRAKAKYSEFQTQQAQRANQGQLHGQGYQPENLSPSGDRYTRPPPISGNVGGGRGGEQNRGLGGDNSGLWGDTRSPSVRSESISSESTYDAPVQTAAPIRQGSHRWQPSDAFDDPLPPQPQRSGSSSTRIEVMGSGRRSPGVTGAGSPEKTTGKIDPAKLGILPKKRVDLMSTSPNNGSPLDRSKNPNAPNHINTNTGASANAYDDDDPNPSLPNASHSLVSKIPPTPPAADDRYRLEDSDDELEYTKNPFDER